MPPDSASPSATPRRESRDLSGKPARTRSTRNGTLRVPLSPPASLPSGSRCSPRERTWIHTGPAGTLKEHVFGTALLRARPRIDWRGSFGQRPSGHRPPVHPFPATPRRRGSRIPRLAVRALQVTRPGQKPWSSVPSMHALRSSLFLCTEAQRIGRFLGDKTTRSLLGGASISFHAETCPDPPLPFGSALGDRLCRHVETFWLGFPLEPRPWAQRIGFGPVRGVEASRTSGIADRTTLRGRLFVGAEALLSGHSLRAGFSDRPPRGVGLAPVPRHRSSRVTTWRGHRGSPFPPHRGALDLVHPSDWSSNHDRVRRGPKRQRCLGTRLHRRD